MRKLYILLFIIAVLLVGLWQSAVSDSRPYDVYGVVQRCDSDDGCPGETVAGATVELRYFYDDEWVLRDTVSQSTGNYGFTGVPPSTQCQIRATKDSWSVGWYYFTTPSEGQIEFDLMTDMEINQCSCN